MALPLPVLLAEEFHDIAPPVNYSLIPPWMIGLAVFAVLTLLGLTVWWLVRRYRRSIPPPPLPRDRALAALASGAAEIEDTNPYQFSIRVSDILRGYVAEQFGVPLTRQTSYEFLEQVKRGSTFSEEEKTLLEAFLGRCDLIKFARYEATPNDSRLLLDEAVQFVKGGHPVYASV